MWVTKLLIFPVEIRIFCPKTTKFGPKLEFLVNLGQAMQAYLVSCWWVSWWLWRAGCISQDTYLLYFIIVIMCKGGKFNKGAVSDALFLVRYCFQQADARSVASREVKMSFGNLHILSKHQFQDKQLFA